MVRPVAGGWLGSFALVLLASQSDNGLVRAGADYLGDVILILTALATLVLFGWNVLHPDEEARQERLERSLRAGPPPLPWGVPRIVRPVQELTALQRALVAGTVSVNGRRITAYEAHAMLTGEAVIDGRQGHLKYAGPPPVYTPPNGYEEEEGFPVRDVPWCLLRAAAACPADSPCHCREQRYL